MKRRTLKRQRLLVWILSVVIIASMLCGFIATMVTPRAKQQPAPETIWPVATPTLTPGSGG